MSQGFEIKFACAEAAKCCPDRRDPPVHLPLSDRSLRGLFRFRPGARSLPVEMGRRLRMARVCPLCPGMHVGNERLYVFDCPSFDDICVRHCRLLNDSHGAMRLFVWHPHQRGVAFCLLQMLDRIDQLLCHVNVCVICRSAEGL